MNKARNNPSIPDNNTYVNHKIVIQNYSANRSNKWGFKFKMFALTPFRGISLVHHSSTKGKYFGFEQRVVQK